MVAGEAKAGDSTGNGPVNALFKAVDEAITPVLGWYPVLTEYEIRAVSGDERRAGPGPGPRPPLVGRGSRRRSS